VTPTLLTGLLIPFNIVSFQQIEWRANITPEGWTCQGNSVELRVAQVTYFLLGNLLFATDPGDNITRPLSCHIDREYAYFLFFLFIRLAQILLAIFYTANIVYLVKYKKNLNAQKKTRTMVNKMFVTY